jgi:hypothetical protein
MELQEDAEVHRDGGRKAKGARNGPKIDLVLVVDNEFNDNYHDELFIFTFFTWFLPSATFILDCLLTDLYSLSELLDYICALSQKSLLKIKEQILCSCWPTFIIICGVL